jgi:hypothetical protein
MKLPVGTTLKQAMQLARKLTGRESMPCEVEKAQQESENDRSESIFYYDGKVDWSSCCSGAWS